MTHVATQLSELPELRVTLDRLEFRPSLEGTPDLPHAFVYFITIKNGSDRVVTIRGRKWVLTDDSGRTMVYEGDGICGDCPRLQPGESFHYDSYHLVATNTAAEGAYVGIDANGIGVFTRIPRFIMAVPRS